MNSDNLLFTLNQPDLVEDLSSVLNELETGLNASEGVVKRRQMQMRMVNPDAMALYVCAYLSDPQYINRITREEELGFLEFSARAGALGKSEAEKAELDAAVSLVRRNQHLSKTFGVLSEIAHQYFHDLNTVAAAFYDYDTVEASKEMLAEARIGFFSRELLLYMFYGIADDVRGVESIDGVFERALANAQENGAFKITKFCPFGAKISEFLDIHPVRDPQSAGLNFAENQSCALPTFVFDEIVDDIRKPDFNVSQSVEL